jgi:hypothetical protein
MVLLGAFLSVSGGVMVLYIARRLFLGHQSRFWPAVAGVLDAVEYKRGKSLTVRVRYRYRVDAREFTGTHYRVGDTFGAHPTHLPGAPEMQPGAALQVRHHPNRPHLSTLVAGSGRWARCGALVTLAFAIMYAMWGLFLVVSGITAALES